MTGGARKYVEMEEVEERDEAARPCQAAETDWFKVITFGCAPSARCKRARPGLPRRCRGRGSARVRA